MIGQDYLDELRTEDAFIRKAERLSLIHGHDPQFEDAWFMLVTNKTERGGDEETDASIDCSVEN